MINALIVEDEPNARDDLEEKILTHPEFNIIGKCVDAFEAIKEINSKHPDVVFLDIEMPQISGLEMLCMLDKADMPRIVFVTAYSKYAVEAFEKNAIDYLLKPVKMNRLNITLDRLKENCQPQPVVVDTLSTELKFIPCYIGNQKYLIPKNKVGHAYSTPTTGVHIITQDCQEYHTDLLLKVLEERTPLVRCHRQHLVNIDYIKLIEKLENGGEIRTCCDAVIPISRHYIKQFEK